MERIVLGGGVGHVLKGILSESKKENARGKTQKPGEEPVQDNRGAARIRTRIFPKNGEHTAEEKY